MKLVNVFYYYILYNMSRKVCNLKKSECEKSSECEWIVGKGCVPRSKPPSNQNEGFDSLPRDVKKLIASKLSPKNATMLKLTNKENKGIIGDIKLTDADYLEYGMKPYAKDLLISLHKYAKTYRQKLAKSLTRPQPTWEETKGAKESIKQQLPQSHPKLTNLSLVMKKDPNAAIRKLNFEASRAISMLESRNALENKLEYTTKAKIEKDIKQIRTTRELEDYVFDTVHKEYNKSYWYVLTQKYPRTLFMPE
jgi:hypothetical protein